MKTEEKSKTAKEIKLEEYMSRPYLTIHGRLTVRDLVKKFGLPKAVLEYAKVEDKSGLVSKPTIVVERFVDGKLYFSDDIVISGIPKSIIVQMDYSGIETVFVRHPTYNPSNMIKATEKEIQGI